MATRNTAPGGRSASSAGFAGATGSWGEVRKGGEETVRATCRGLLHVPVTRGAWRVKATWPREIPHPVGVPLRAPASPAQPVPGGRRGGGGECLGERGRRGHQVRGGGGSEGGRSPPPS